jgi:RimJ/RimL family protein N-acetyltransferase
MKLLIGGLELAQFTADDVQTLYDVRNHESVRSFMSNAAPLAWDRHVAWVQDNLLSGGQILLMMVRMNGEAVGFTLLKLFDADTGEIGVVVRDAARHRLVAAEAGAATLHLGFEVIGFARLLSYVVPAHVHALDFNRRGGGREIQSDKPGMRAFEFRRETYAENPHCARMLARMRPRLQLIKV